VPPPPPPVITPVQDRTNQQVFSSLTAEQKLKNLVAEIKTTGKTVSDFDAEEIEMRKSAQVGSKKYSKSNTTLLNNLFSTVINHATDHTIKSLCIKGSCPDNISTDYNFFHRLSGKREEWKRVIIDQMLIIWFLRRKN
jgi:hypothetical protein